MTIERTNCKNRDNAEQKERGQIRTTTAIMNQNNDREDELQ